MTKVKNPYANVRIITKKEHDDMWVNCGIPRVNAARIDTFSSVISESSQPIFSDSKKVLSKIKFKGITLIKDPKEVIKNYDQSLSEEDITVSFLSGESLHIAIQRMKLYKETFSFDKTKLHYWGKHSPVDISGINETLLVFKSRKNGET